VERISIVTTCKGRLHHIKRALPAMLDQSYPNIEVILVDYSCPDKATEWALANYADNPRLKVVMLLEGGELFSPSHARNLGGIHATGGKIGFVDGDIILSTDWAIELDKVVRGDTVLALPEEGNAEAVGTCMVTAAVYDKVNGYAEDLEQWGFQDLDFYRRASRLGSQVRYPLTYVDVISHDDEERMKHYSTEVAPATSSNYNARVADKRGSRVNVTGYGQGKVELFGF